jgi:hypothetical protein
MRAKEHPPLISAGFKNISEKDFTTEFVNPVNSGKEYRKELVDNFNQFLSQFKLLNIEAEIWIDGSFATHAPDPSDVDVVFYFRQEEVDALTEDSKQVFERLFTQRKFMRNLYRVDIHYGRLDDESYYKQWRQTFGTCYDNITLKGIFRLYHNIQ